MSDQSNDVPPRNWSTLFLFVIFAVVLMTGGVVFLGIPGALVAGVTAPVVELVRGFRPGLLTDGDRAWGVALLTTIIFPPGLPLSYWISKLAWPGLNTWLRALVIVAGTWTWSVLALLVASFFL